MTQTFPSKKKVLSGSGRKRKGARQELRAKALLEKEGYSVTKAGGSLGAFDLIAIGKGTIRLVQVKSNRRCPKKEQVVLAEHRATVWDQVTVYIEEWVFHDGTKQPEVFLYPRQNRS